VHCHELIGRTPANSVVATFTFASNPSNLNALMFFLRRGIQIEHELANANYYA
jgi:hypothetical protein